MRQNHLAASAQPCGGAFDWKAGHLVSAARLKQRPMPVAHLSTQAAANGTPLQLAGHWCDAFHKRHKAHEVMSTLGKSLD